VFVRALCGGGNFGQKSVLRGTLGEDLRVGGSVRGMAGDAGVALARPTAEIPVAAHPSVCARLVVAKLGAVALRAELLHLVKRECSSVGEAQGSAIPVRVTARTSEVPMPKFDPRVKRLEARALCESAVRAACMTRGALDSDRLTARIEHIGVDDTQTLGKSDRDGVAR